MFVGKKNQEETKSYKLWVALFLDIETYWKTQKHLKLIKIINNIINVILNVSITKH